MFVGMYVVQDFVHPLYECSFEPLENKRKARQVHSNAALESSLPTGLEASATFREDPSRCSVHP